MNTRTSNTPSAFAPIVTIGRKVRFPCRSAGRSVGSGPAARSISRQPFGAGQGTPHAASCAAVNPLLPIARPPPHRVTAERRPAWQVSPCCAASCSTNTPAPNSFAARAGKNDRTGMCIYKGHSRSPQYPALLPGRCVLGDASTFPSSCRLSRPIFLPADAASRDATVFNGCAAARQARCRLSTSAKDAWAKIRATQRLPAL